MLCVEGWNSICTVYHQCVAPNRFCTLEYIRDSYPFVLQVLMWKHSGSVVECLIRDRGATGLSLTGVTALCP